MLAAGTGASPDPTLAGLALMVSAVCGGVGAILTAVLTFRTKGALPNRRRGRTPWPKDARDTIARLTRERDAAIAEASDWKARYDGCDTERLDLLRHLAGGT